jgi:hypothetical protein
MIEELVQTDLLERFRLITELFSNPTSNTSAFLLLLGLIVVVVLILGLSAVLLWLRASARAYEDRQLMSDPGAPQRGSALTRLYALLFIFGMFALAWIATGISTSSTQVCSPCHAHTSHEQLADEVVHGSIACTRCHEPGGVVHSVTFGTPARFMHVLEMARGTDTPSEYGYVDSTSCLDCHARDIAGTTDNEESGIRISHAEPLDAGARCVDCHRLNESGLVDVSAVGMDPCLRCHDGQQASSECESCHTKDIAYSAIADARPTPDTAMMLIDTPHDCYRCHETAACDACHGMRLPHPEEFVENHRYPGVLSIWAGSNGQCVGCHTESRNSCSKAGCHGSEFPYHYSRDKQFRTSHTTGRWLDRRGLERSNLSNLGCGTCHGGGVCIDCHGYEPQSTPFRDPRLDLDLEDE